MPSPPGQGSCYLLFTFRRAFVETRLLILNADPVFQDRALAILDEIDNMEARVVRTMSEAVSVLLDHCSGCTDSEGHSRRATSIQSSS